MQIYQFTLQANQRPETLERILRIIRHRGFYIVALQVQTENDIAHCAFTVKSERALNLLINQLTKMYDVLAITPVQA